MNNMMANPAMAAGRFGLRHCWRSKTKSTGIPSAICNTPKGNCAMFDDSSPNDTSSMPKLNPLIGMLTADVPLKKFSVLSIKAPGFIKNHGAMIIAVIPAQIIIGLSTRRARACQFPCWLR